MWLEALGQTDLRQGDALQTVGLLTALAVEVRVLVVVVLMVVAVAELVARAVAAALDDVQRLAVGLMPCSSSRATHSFSSMAAKVIILSKKGRNEFLYQLM